MAHPARQAWAEQLSAELDAPIVWDQGCGVWDTARRALRTHSPDASHVLVVQDDAIICRDLIPGLEAAVEYAGLRPIGLYVGARPYARQVAMAMRAASKSGASWISAEHWALSAVAVAHPIHLVDELVEFGDTYDRPADDAKTRAFYAQSGLAAWYTWPSLVDHRPGPSLLDHPSGRTALRFIGEQASALDVDWSLPPHIAP